jgi:molecular chaperone DnaK
LVQQLRGPFEQAISDASLSAGAIDEIVLVGGATRMPMVQELVRDLTGKEPHKGVNPDEVVSVGAALQAGVLGGEVKDVVLLDVTPLSLGVETLGGVFTKLIERNTTIPTRKSETFSTAEDSQTAVDIKVYQGERPMAANNMLLGQFRLEGIPPAPRGVPQIEVTYDIDANGILNVSAEDKATGKQQAVTIQATTNLTESDIENMVKQAEEHRAEDESRRNLVEARNRADTVAYQMEKMLEEQGDNMPQDVRSDLEGKIEHVREVMQGDNLNRINSAVEDLQQAAQQVGQQMYEQPEQPGAPSEDGGSPDGEDEDVVEGEFREA